MEKCTTITEGLSILIASWNLFGKPADQVCLKGWLCETDGGGGPPPDFIVIGFQELEWSHSYYKNELPPVTGEVEKAWRKAVETALQHHSPGTKYQELKSVRLDGILLLVYIKNDLMKYVKNASSSLGNKGGVAVGFDFGETSICFVNCHLSPHPQNWEERNQNYHQIWEGMEFQDGVADCNSRKLQDFKHIIMFGDLNYRINSSNISTEDVKALIAQGDFAKCLKHDQLNEQKRTSKAFGGFIEGPITFPPTYKYDCGTQSWDSSVKQRMPAWCDRILYNNCRNQQNSSLVLKQLSYKSHPEYTLSDHKPISSLYKFSKFKP